MSAISRREILRLAGGGTGAALLSACGATNVATGRSSYTGGASIQDDIRIGRKEHPRILAAFGGAYDDRRVQSYVGRIGRRLAAYTEYQQYPYTFTVLNSSIVNAFALPGGFVYVSRGLMALASNEAELAGVLAHELSHVNARHGAERRGAVQIAQLGVIAAALGASALGINPRAVARLGQGVAAVAVQSYSRDQELEADTLGIRYMSRASYDPDAMGTFLASMREQAQLEAEAKGLPAGSVDEYNFLSTHPRTLDRLAAARRAARVRRPAHPTLARAAYLRVLDSLLFGDDPAQGVIRGRLFIHPALRFAFTVPPGFRLQNSPENVIARRRDGATLVFDMAKTRLAADPLRYLVGEWAPDARFRESSRLRAAGAAAATGVTPARSRRGTVDLRLVAITRDARSVYRFAFISPGAETAALSREYRSVIEGFERLGREEAARIRPLRIRIVRAKASDRVERLARGLPFGARNPRWFRVLNDLPPGGEPSPGQALKVVRPG